jgi:hypothetical protein
MCRTKRSGREVLPFVWSELTLIAQALTKSGPVMLLGQIKKELQEDKERQQQPRITRGLLWTGISIVFFVLWCLRLYQHSAEFGTVVLGLVNAFLILGFGVREFVRYLLLDRGDEKHCQRARSNGDAFLILPRANSPTRNLPRRLVQFPV